MKFRKKPIIVEAEQWFPGRHIDGVIEPEPMSVTQFFPFIDTLEGPVTLMSGDWIITDPDGQKHVCKPDVFEKTYERVE